MDKERAIELWNEQLAGEISPEDQKLLNAYLQQNPGMKSEFDEITQTWDILGDLPTPEPSPQMDARFHAMMANQKTPEKESNPMEILVSWFAQSWQMGLASLIIGLLIGWQLLPSSQQNKEVASLTSEIQDMKKMMMLTLIEQPKAQDRIQAVNMVSNLSSSDDKVIEALITTLNTDDNLNVRLAAVESLAGLGNVPQAREALVMAIGQQQSPIIQVAIADALVLIQAKNSVEELEALRETVEDNLVKDKLEQSIKTLKSI